MKLTGAFVGGVGAQQRNRLVFVDWNNSAITVDGGRRGIDDGKLPAVP
jgi:hypothetical protein